MEKCCLVVRPLVIFCFFKVVVTYVDFGVQEAVDVHKLRAILPEMQLSLTDQPALALPCQLVDLPPKGGVWTDEALYQLQSLVDGCNLKLRMINADESPPEVKVM